MDHNIEEIVSKIRALEEELHESLKQTEEFFTFKHGRVIFSTEEVQKQKREAQNLLAYLAATPVKHIITAPVIYTLILPALFLDLFATLYQTICFPVYGIKRVKRRHYIVLDRHRLHHLNIIEKLNCFYCGYFNGLIAYVREIAGRTELYWCPIRHAKHGKSVHSYYFRFSDYGNFEGLREKWEAQREWLKKMG